MEPTPVNVTIPADAGLAPFTSVVHLRRYALQQERRKHTMSTRQIHVFVSHSWSYYDHYDTLSNWIFNRNWSVGQASLDFRDFSVPRNDPIHNATNDAKLRGNGVSS
jgi:hypothetical protein